MDFNLGISGTGMNSCSLPPIPANKIRKSFSKENITPLLVADADSHIQEMITIPLSTASEKSTFRIVPCKDRKPTAMHRAKVWSTFVENAFRYQLAGYRDVGEYLEMYPEPDYWEGIGLVKCLRAKATGFFMYFRRNRECEDRHLNKIKIYDYPEAPL